MKYSVSSQGAVIQKTAALLFLCAAVFTVIRSYSQHKKGKASLKLFRSQELHLFL